MKRESLIEQTLHGQKARLDELRILDTAPQGFNDFLTKYRKLSRKGETRRLYVHFSSYRSSSTDKRASSSPDHTDPVGIYTYPMEYVLKHPADLWYGIGARFLHVIEDTSKNPLYLSEIGSNSNIDRIMYRMGLSSLDDRFLNKIRRRFDWKGRGRFAKTFMSAIQFDWTTTDIKDRDMTTRPGIEQTRLFRKARYDAIIDAGTGAINEREPEQAVFLTRSAFKMIEMFQLRAGTPRKMSDPVKSAGYALERFDKIENPSREAQDTAKALRANIARFETETNPEVKNRLSDAIKNRSNHLNMLIGTGDIGDSGGPPMTVNDHNSNTLLQRKIAALSAQAVGDNLVKGEPETANLGGWRVYWTVSGMRVSVMAHDSSIQRRMDTLKIGEKPHKWHKAHDEYVVDIEIQTPYGEITHHIYPSDKFKDAFNSISKEWLDLKQGEADSEWEPENRERFFAKKERERKFQMWNKIRREAGLPEIDQTQMDTMIEQGKTPLEYFTTDKVNQMRREHGLPEWTFDQYQYYREGKVTDPLYSGPVGPSRYSFDRLDRVLKMRARQHNPESGIGAQGEESEAMRSMLYKSDRDNPEFGPRSLAYINGVRQNLPPMTPEQYQRYRRNPDGWEIDRYFPDQHVKES